MSKKILWVVISMITIKANSQTPILQPGDIDPKAIYLEVDEMHPFNNGAALVKKGKSTALIDPKGNFLIPFNKYNISKEFGLVDIQERKSMFNFGLFILADGQEAGSLLTSEGKIIHNPDPARKFTFNINNGEWVGKLAVGSNLNWVNTKNGKTYSVNVKTNVVNFTESDREYGLYPFREQNGSLSGYRDFYGKVVIKPIYFSAEPFCDGMALVARYNSYNELKWGFVDTTGKESVPCSLSKTPTNFYNGMAVIFPKTNEEFDYACIDNKGNILKAWKLDKSSQTLNASDFELISGTKYIMGYRMKEGYMINNQGVSISVPDFLASLGIKSPPKTSRFKFNIIKEDPIKHKLYYEIPFSGPPNANSSNHLGIFDIETKKEIQLPVDNSIILNSNWFIFDSKSGLAYAEIVLSKDKNGISKVRKGYINEKGNFVIVMKPSSTF